jgi:RsiW-degrading membrane proteinase PrsW (M82 family)
MTLALLSLLAAVIPIIFYLIVIWKLDRYDREPLWLVTLNFLWGAVGAIIFGYLGSVLLLKTLNPVLYKSLENSLSAIVIAPFVEEITKGIFLLFVTAPMKDFDNMTDGVVYGASIGLGFGMTENFLYFLGVNQNIEQWLMMIIVRSVFSAVMHACSTAAFGAFIGYAKFHSTKRRGLFISIGLLVAMLIHFTWNFLVQPGSSYFVLGAVFIIVSVIVMFILFQVSLNTESKLIKKELSEEAQLGTIPDEHLNYLPYTHLRNKKEWLPLTVDHQRYIQIATTLAFRKQQSRTCPERRRAFYLQEVEDAREEISHLLYGTPI